MIHIQSNGSRWAGEEPATINDLVTMLNTHPLDPSFERYGNFIIANPISATTREPLLPKGGVRFFGNFYAYSHGFSIDTDEAAIIDGLTTAIRANQQTADYRNAKAAQVQHVADLESERQRRVSKETEEYERRQLAQLQAKYAT
jgi:hypothetical protein